jgi:hypothetical protein
VYTYDFGGLFTLKQSLCLALALAAPTFAGVRIQLDSTDLTTGEVTKREILVDAERLRMNETGKSTNTSVLFLTDGGRNRLVVLDKAKNEYREIDQQTVEQLSGQMSAATAKMQEQMKNLTPEQRAMMEQMMKGRGLPGAAAASVTTAARTTYTSKGSGTANGFACTKYEGTRGAEKVSEVCAASPSELKFAASDLQVYEKMKEFSASMMSMATSSPFFNANTVSSMTESGFSGFPVQQTSFSNGKASSRTDTKAIDRATFSNADFSLGNATKVDVMGAAKGRGR